MKTVRLPLMLLLTGVLVCCVPWDSSADKIEGKFVFEKKSPFIGLLYFSDDKPSEAMRSLEVDQIDKAFTKKIVVGTSGAKVIFKNSDTIDHNIYTNDTKTGILFDAGLVPPGKDSAVDMNWPQDHVIRIGCKIHPNMRSYIANIPGAHHVILEFAEGNTEYSFVMDNVPGDIQKMRLWLPQYSPLEFSLAAGEAKELSLEKGEGKSGVLKIERH